MGLSHHRPHGNLGRRYRLYGNLGSNGLCGNLCRHRLRSNLSRDRPCESGRRILHRSGHHRLLRGDFGRDRLL
ncbi:hypothetical protein KDA82_39275, partial [Streptomyces daliensis]|nr:hypothetical protein [Streptomyces daliensis]